MARNEDKVWYIIGDVVEVKMYDEDTEEIVKGIVEITGWDDSEHTRYGMYDLRCLSGNVPYFAVNVNWFQESVIKYLGNIEKNKALRVLYGK